MRASACFAFLLALLAWEARLGGAAVGLGPFLAWDALLIVAVGTLAIVAARFPRRQFLVSRPTPAHLDFGAWAALRVGALSSLLYVIVALEYEQPALLLKRIGVGLTGLFFGALLSFLLKVLASIAGSSEEAGHTGPPALKPKAFLR